MQGPHCSPQFSYCSTVSAENLLFLARSKLSIQSSCILLGAVQSRCKYLHIFQAKILLKPLVISITATLCLITVCRVHIIAYPVHVMTHSCSTLQCPTTSSLSPFLAYFAGVSGIIRNRTLLAVHFTNQNVTMSVYVNSMLASLNARDRLRRRMIAFHNTSGAHHPLDIRPSGSDNIPLAALSST